MPSEDSVGGTQQGFYPTLEKIAVAMAAFGIIMFLLDTLGWLPW